MKPCPHCESVRINFKGNAPNIQAVCLDCGAEGPRAEAIPMAEALWNRRPIESFWKRVAAWLGSVHAANAFEYEAKSVSKSRRARQISILTKVHEALYDGKMPEGAITIHLDEDDQAKVAGSRAFNECRHLEAVQAQS